MSDRETCTHERWDQAEVTVEQVAEAVHTRAVLNGYSSYMASLTAGHCPTCLLEENERLRAEPLREIVSDTLLVAMKRADDAEARIDAALALHQKVDAGMAAELWECSVCIEDWPCPTVKALKGEK